tara:strand:- start:18933 stop:19604 length:672 start_codon:yes stop_codon:yes gene_type:complete
MATDLILPQGVDIEQDAYRTSQSLKNLSTETLPPSTVDGYILQLVGGVPTWVAPDVEKISYQVLTSDTLSINIENIPAEDYSDLKIVCHARSDNAGTVNWGLQANDVTTGTYYTQDVLGLASALYAGDFISDNQWIIGLIPGSTAHSALRGHAEVNISEPNASGNINFTSLNSYADGFTSGSMQARFQAGNAGVGPIDSLRVFCIGGSNMVSGSSVALYGYRK